VNSAGSRAEGISEEQILDLPRYNESEAFDGGVVTSTCPDQPGNFVRWKLTSRR